jgi:hypothetical protein
VETTKRKVGRPRKYFVEQQPVVLEEKKPATEARRVVVAEDDGDDEPNTEIVKYPLFAGAPLGIDESSTPQHLLVSREGPVPEGHLGRLEPTATEADLKNKWGGGTYRIEARTAGGRAIKGGVARLIVAGEPFLQSDMAQLEYRRQMILMKGSSRERTADSAGEAGTERQEARPTLVAHAAPMPAPAPSGTDSTLVALITAMMTSSAQTNQTMLQLVTEGAKQRETSQWEMFKLLAANKESADPLGAFREGMKLMRAIGGGEKEVDTIDRVLNAAGPILDKVASVVRAEKMPAPAAPAAAAAAPAPKPSETAIWAAMNEIAERPDCMLLEGALGTFANQAISHLISLGVKAEVALANIFKFAAKLNLDEARDMGLLGDVAPAPAVAPAPDFVPPANTNGITSGPVASPIS